MRTADDDYEADANELRDRLYALILTYPPSLSIACLGAQTEALIACLAPGLRERTALWFIRKLARGVLAEPPGDPDEDGDGEA